MSRGEDKAKRWRISVLDLLAFVTSICLAIGMLRFAVTTEFDVPQLNIAIGFLGVFVLMGSVGGFAGKLFCGNNAGAREGVLYSHVAVVIVVLAWLLLRAI